MVRCALTGEISERREEGGLLLPVQPAGEELQRVEEGGQGGQGEEEGRGGGQAKGDKTWAILEIFVEFFDNCARIVTSFSAPSNCSSFDNSRHTPFILRQLRRPRN